MAGISFDGVVSGMDTSSIVENLISIDSKPLIALEDKKTEASDKISVWKEMTAILLSLKIDSYALSRESTFNTKDVSSTDESILSAVATSSAIEGSYSFTVNKLAQAHQMLSSGYEDSDTTPVGAGDITFEFGKGSVAPSTKLDYLNGQTGVARGSIRITDRSGSTSVIDLSTITDVSEVIDAINTDSDVNVTASINSEGNGIVITDNTGSTSSNLKIEDYAGGSTATDLGIVADVASNSVNGSSIYYVNADTNLNLLNDGTGIRFVGTEDDASGASDDIRITMSDGTDVDINLSGSNELQDILDKITAADANLTATLVDDGNGNNVISITDTAGGGGNLTVTALNGSKAAFDLGIEATGTGASLTGDSMVAGIDRVMLKNLNGGNLTIDDITMTLRDGTSVTLNADDDLNAGALRFDNATSLQEFISLANQQIARDNPGKYQLQVNGAGNGVEVVDLTGSTASNLIIDDTSSMATGLGIATDVAGVAQNSVSGNSQLRYISENTLLSDLNSGQGAEKGKIKFTNKNGNSTIIDFSADYIKTIGDVVDKINSDASGFSISASINSTGDGILISDSSGGSNNLIIDDYGGSFASDLNIVDNVSGTTLDGSFETTISIAATDTLDDVRDKINDAGLDLKASVINDGSVSGAYKLMLTSSNTGEAGKIIFDGSALTGGEGLSMNTVANAQNAVFSLGSQGIGSSPQVMYKSTNTVDDVINGVSLQLKSVSTQAVTISLSENHETVVTAVETFVETYNKLNTYISDNTYYDSETNMSGHLQGDYTVNQIKNDLFSAIIESVDGLPSSMNNITQVGIGFGLDGSMTLNADMLTDALQEDLEAVKKLFTYTVNVGSAAEGATVSSSSVEAGYSNEGAIDGNTSYADFESQATGWQAAGGVGNYLQIDFADTFTLQKFHLYSIDTLLMPADSNTLKAFDFDYWDLTSSSWKTAKSYSTNSQDEVIHYLSSPVSTNKIRLNNVEGAGSYANVTEFEVYEARGIGSRLDDLIARFTDSVDGTITTKVESINEDIGYIDNEIEVWNERLLAKEARYKVEFQQMEAYMQQFQTQSQWLSTQLSSINSGWSLRDGGS